MNTKYNFVPAVMLAAGVLTAPAYAKAAVVGSSALPTTSSNQMYEGQGSAVSNKKADKKADKKAGCKD